VAALSQGLAITVAPQHTVLTTGQAADLLGVSRPTLVRLLEAGEIPFNKPGRHRRIRLGDLLAYQQRARRARAVGLDEMVRVSNVPRDITHDANRVSPRPSGLVRGRAIVSTFRW
jgi:excisionase family DNA binding protein